MPKVGRPESKDPKKNVPVRIRMSLRKKVEKAAQKADRSLSYVIEKALEEKFA